MFRIEYSECIDCGICANYCPMDAFSVNGYYFYINPNLCNSCGDCLDLCPVSAIWDDGEFQVDDPPSIFNSSDFLDSIALFENTPFLMGGLSPTNGTDCAGLIWLVYCELGLYYNKCSTSGFSTNSNWVRVYDPQYGDTVVWPGHHSGIFTVGNTNLYYMSAGNNHPVHGYISWFTGVWGQPEYYRYKP